MIYSLAPVAAAQKIVAQLAKMEINAILQTGIEVLQKEGEGAFLIKMGRHTLQTKSETPLTPGKEYWVDIEESKKGIIHLTRLHPRPETLKKGVFTPLGGSDILEKIAQDRDPVESFKERVLYMMASSQSKDQFQSLAQMLLALHNGVVTMPIQERGKRAILQMKRRRAQESSSKEKSVEFYAAFNNLGPIEGRIVIYEKSYSLSLEVFYPKTARLLSGLKDKLSGFSNISVKIRDSFIFPFWESERLSLLDIKG
ncbi:MAG: hypothetical protein L3J42_05400 [Hydrogenimonas sp.]|nr:hypothetical protein [Hydrogenimonas sp.]